MSIDDASKEDWDSIIKSTSYKKASGSHKHDVENTLKDDAVNYHPVYSDTAPYDESDLDMVHKPSHYNNGEIECIDAIKAMLTPDEFVGYLRGNSLKYRWRFRYKNKPIEDLRKARWYEERLMKFLMENPDVLG